MTREQGTWLGDELPWSQMYIKYLVCGCLEQRHTKSFNVQLSYCTAHLCFIRREKANTFISTCRLFPISCLDDRKFA